MKFDIKTLLTIGAVAVGGYLVYNYVTTNVFAPMYNNNKKKPRTTMVRGTTIPAWNTHVSPRISYYAVYR